MVAEGIVSEQVVMLRGWLFPGSPEVTYWLLAVPNWIGLAGLAAVMLGFATDRIVPPRNSGWHTGAPFPDT